jgi:hypothetical protein
VKRKERLAALKRKLAGNGGDTGNAEKKATDENTDLPKPIFRYPVCTKKVLLKADFIIFVLQKLTSRAYMKSRDSIYGVERNFVGFWRRPNCRSQVILRFTLYIQL